MSAPLLSYPYGFRGQFRALRVVLTHYRTDVSSNPALNRVSRVYEMAAPGGTKLDRRRLTPRIKIALTVSPRSYFLALTKAWALA